MATTTTKLGLTKPDYVDVVDVADLNTNANLIDAAVGMTICTSATRPASPWSGQIIFETDTLIPYVWDGSAWQVAGGGGGGVTVSATAPASPSEGDLWWDSDDGKLFVYYNDGTTSQWVDAAGPSVAVQSTAPTGYEGQLWLDSTDGSMYVYYTDPGGGSSSWIGAVSRSGGILQVVQTEKTDVFSTTSTTFTDVTGLSASITPRSTSSKILVIASVNVGTDTSSAADLLLLRDSTSLHIGDAAGSRLRVTRRAYAGTTNGQSDVAITFLDSPSTTASTTYKIQLRTNSGSPAVKINASPGDADVASNSRSACSITLLEVAG